jgi:hypothetical protein
LRKVVANALGTLLEINEVNPKAGLFSMDETILNKLLAALNECSE